MKKKIRLLPNKKQIKKEINHNNFFIDNNVRMNLPIYVNSNSKQFPEFIREHFISSNMDMSSSISSNSIDAKNHQKFAANYISDNTPYKSILLYHGLGSGKTAASILIAEGNQNKKYIVLAPASLKVNYIDEVGKFADIFGKISDEELLTKYKWSFLSIPVKVKYKMIEKELKNKLINKKVYAEIYEKIQTVHGKKKGGVYLITPPGTDSKNLLTIENTMDNYNLHKQGILAQTFILKKYKKDIRQSKYKTYSYDANMYTLINIFEEELPEQYKKHLLKTAEHPLRKKSTITKDEQLDFLNLIFDEKKPEITNPFDNKIIIVDEIHNLVSKIHNKSFYGLRLYELIMRSKNSKFIFLSGTPVINFPYELGILCNMLKGLIHGYEFVISGSELDIRKSLDSCYYIDRYKIENSKLLVTLPPNNFKREFGPTADSTLEYKGLTKYTDSDIIVTEKNLYDALSSTLETITIHENFKKKHFSIFPGMFNEEIIIDSNDREEFIKSRHDIENDINDFNNFYIDEEEITIKNELNFKNRIIGLVSFYNEIVSADTIIFPEKIIADTSETFVEMSDYQFIHYSKERDRERKLEKISRKTQSTKSILDTQPSYFKVFSRQAGIFVFPPHIIRPRKNRDYHPGEVLRPESSIDSDILEPAEDPEEPEDYAIQLSNAVEELSDEHLSITSSVGNLYNLSVLSPKYAKILENIYNTNGNIFIYSQYRSVEGVGIFIKVLNCAGFKQYEVDDTKNNKLEIGNTVRYIDPVANGDITSGSYKFGEILSTTNTTYTIKDKHLGTLQDIVYSDSAPNIFPCRYILWTGTEGHEERKKSLDYFNTVENKYGNHCLILITTETGAEGISLKCVRQVHIMEPYWNNVRKKQVIGRARRVLSHDDLNDDEKNVKIFEYTIKYSKTQLNSTTFADEFIDTLRDESNYNRRNIEAYTRLLSDDYGFDLNQEIEDIKEISDVDDADILGKTIEKLVEKKYKSVMYKISELCADINIQDHGKTSDEVLNEIATKKEIILNKLLYIIKQSAVDCEYNLEDNKKSDTNLETLRCYNNIQSSNEYNYKLQSLSDSSKDTDMSLIKSISKSKIPVKAPINIPDIGKISVLIFQNETFDSIDELPANITKIYDYYTYKGFNPYLDISSRGTEEIIGRIIKTGGITNKIEFSNEAIIKNMRLYKIIEDIIEEHTSVLNKDLSDIENINTLRAEVKLKFDELTASQDDESQYDDDPVKCPSCSNDITNKIIDGDECTGCGFPRSAAQEYWS